MTLDALHGKIRRACSEQAWSFGVRLVRVDAVQGVSQNDEEVVLSVRAPNQPDPLRVHLWPGEDDWSCECGHAACGHVAAAIIAARSGVMPKPSGAVRLRYSLRRTPRGLAVERHVLRSDGSVEPVKGAIRQIGGLHPRPADLEAEDVLRVATERIAATGWARLLRAFSDSEIVLLLDGQPIKASPVPITPVVQVRDEGAGFRLSLHRDKRISEVFADGVVLADGVLHPSSDGGLDDLRKGTLLRGVVFGPEEVGMLVGEVLPQLRRGLTVRVQTQRLPEGSAAKPSLQLELQPKGDGLALRLDLVYGDPPVARIEDDRLVLLGGAVPVRLPDEERRLREQANTMRLSPGRTLELGAEEAVRFVRDRLPEFQGRTRGDPSRFYLRKSPAMLGISADGRRIEGDADPRAVLAAWRAGRGMVPLIGGGYAPLPVELLQKHAALLGDLVASGEGGELPRHALPALAELARALDQPPPPQLEALRPLLEDFTELPPFVAPPGLTATLRPYQQDGVRWIRFLWSVGLNGVLADDMGLGKTLQALCAIAGIGGPTLVVAPTSVIHNWAAEARRFLPGLGVCVYHGTRRKLEPADLTLTSYALVRLDDALSRRRWKVVILDEAQAIKNPESQTAQAAFGLDAEHRLSMTGTPVENRLDELWSQLHFLMRGFFGGRADFRERYAKPIAEGDANAMAALRRRVRPFVLRRRKQEVARDLPPRTDVVLRCELGEAQRAVYDAVREAARDEVARLLGGGKALAVLELLLRLRQAACHPALLPGDHGAVGSGKLEVLLDQVEEVVAEGHKALVFSQWTGFLDLIGEAMAARGLASCRLDGSTRDRAAVVNRFQSEDGPPVFLISLKAGGTGLNLTAADYVFHTDPWWNPAVEAQATDRAHRIGQTRPVVSVKLIAAETVEERIVELQERKRGVAEAAVGDGELLGALTRDELLGLFG